MALNFPGPYEVRIFYTVYGMVHTMRLNCALAADASPGDLFSTVSAVKRDTTSIVLSDAVDDWVALIQPFFNSGNATIDYAELWKYVPGTFDATFISPYGIAVPGTNATTYVIGGQVIQTYRTLEGGIMKLNYMEASYTPGPAQAYGAIGAGAQAIVDHITGDDNIWLGRDTSYPFAFLKQFPGQNEALFKKRYRP